LVQVVGQPILELTCLYHQESLWQVAEVDEAVARQVDQAVQVEA
jgi:hypothetical protein